jgi:hypothetical protein
MGRYAHLRKENPLAPTNFQWLGAPFDEEADLSKQWSHAGMRKFIATTAAGLLIWAALPGKVVEATPSTLVVPTNYPTIQSAVDAAAPGDTVQVLAGSYTEQVSIGKDLAIVGAGMDKTIVRVPSSLSLNALGETSIVEIRDGASVSMTRFTVEGPGSGTCGSGALVSGIRVHGEAHLDFSYGAVRDIHDSPLAACFHSGTAVLVGEVPGPSAHLDINHSEITLYQSAGIVALGFGSTANIDHNTVTGPGAAGGVATDGIEFPVGSVGTITHNTVSGNICPATDASCGPDWFTQFQHAGILAGGWGPGTVVSHNVVFDNQIGLFLGEADEISNNQMLDNDYFNLAMFDGTFVIENSQIKGGGGGVWVIAQGADTHVTLDHVNIVKVSGPAVQDLECCGFTATVTTIP